MRLLVLLLLTNLSWSEQKVTYLKFPSNRKIIPETKNTPEHYALLMNDPKGKLPDKFSICSSLFVGYLRGSTTFLTVLKNDQSQWFALEITEQDLISEKYAIWLDRWKLDDVLSLRPWDWSHACFSMNVIDGHATVVINGRLMLSQTIEDTQFLQSKPRDLTNKIQLGDWKHPTWGVIESENSVSNVHVYANTLTEEEMVLITSGGACTQIGDYLSWLDIKWTLNGNATMEETEEDICQKESELKHQFVFTEKFDWETCMNLCPKIERGRAPGVRNMTELIEIITWFINVDPAETKMWAPYTDAEQEHTWKDFYMKKPINIDFFTKDQPNGGKLQNCGMIDKGGFWDISCNAETYSYYCVCRYMKPPLLRLRGLCRKSYLDSHYTLYQGKLLAFYGLHQTKIEYNQDTHAWQAVIIAYPTKAQTKVDTGLSVLLGRHLWKITNDSASCNDGEPYDRVLKMTGCEDGEFTCRDGQCVNMTMRCDQLTHCKDKSDEMECNILNVEENYNKQVPPFNDTSRAKVNVSMVLLSINDISEIDLTIDLKFTISLEWYETDRVSYHNLKPKVSFNVFSTKEMNQLWTPYAIYSNTDNNEAIKVNHKFKDIKTTMTVTREGDFIRSPLDVVDEI